MRIRVSLAAAMLLAACDQQQMQPATQDAGECCQLQKPAEMIIVPCPLNSGVVVSHAWPNRTPDQVLEVRAWARTLVGGGDLWTTAEVRVNGVNAAADCAFLGVNPTQDITFILPALQ